MPPRVSTAGRVRTRAFLSAIERVPRERMMVEMAGKPSGIAATAKEIDTRSISVMALPRSRPTTKVTAAMAKIIMVKLFPKRS